MITYGMVKGAIDGLKDVVPDAAHFWSRRRLTKRLAGLLDEALRNPRAPFRLTTTLGQIVDDRTEGFAMTRTVLMSPRLAGVRHNARPGGSDTWFNRDNWELDDDGKVVRDANGHGILKQGIEPGRL